jgi:alpha-D-ribose 1-methylphosphonate 5-triphosphate diphosphatase PhnM
MKTNTIQAITTSVAIGLFAGFGATKVSGDSITGIAVALAYLAVLAVLAIASSDYRSASKSYSATTLVTSHFQGTVPAAIALRTPGTKSRLAA